MQINADHCRSMQINAVKHWEITSERLWMCEYSLLATALWGANLLLWCVWKWGCSRYTTKIITFIDKLKSPHNRLYPHNCVAPFQNFNFTTDQLSTINYQYMLRGYTTPNHPRRGGLIWYWNILKPFVTWGSPIISSHAIPWYFIIFHKYLIRMRCLSQHYLTNMSVFSPWLYHEWISHMKDMFFPSTFSILLNPIGGIIKISQ